MSKEALVATDIAGIALGGGRGVALLLFLRGFRLSLLRRAVPFPFSDPCASDDRTLDADLDFASLGAVPKIVLDFDRVVVGDSGNGK